MAEIDWEQRIRDGVAAYNRGDYDGVLAFAHDEVELKRADNSPESRELIRGRRAVLEFFRPDAFDDQRIELLAVEIGDIGALTHQRFTAKGAGSGLPVEITSYVIFRLADELITRVEIHTDEAEARAAAGLG